MISTESSFIELKYIIKISVERLGLQLDKLPIIQLPSQPLLINVATLTRKGCSSYYKLIRKKKNLTLSLADRESKWHNELNKVYGVPFWNKTYAFTASIKNENKIKWMQYQIVRNSQFSNYRVNKFKPSVSPNCSYCGVVEEKLSHLYFNCMKVQDFWIEITNWLNHNSIKFPLNITYILFGYDREPFDSKINYIMLVGKRYIWVNKFKSSPLSFIGFQQMLKHKLNELKEMYEYSGKVSLFDHWLPIFNVL